MEKVNWLLLGFTLLFLGLWAVNGIGKAMIFMGGVALLIGLFSWMIKHLE